MTLPPNLQAKLDECFQQVANQRDNLTPFYDGRIIFACYAEMVQSLAASLIHTGGYSPQQMAILLADLVADALTRESKTKLMRVSGDDVIAGGTQ